MADAAKAKEQLMQAGHGGGGLAFEHMEFDDPVGAGVAEAIRIFRKENPGHSQLPDWECVFGRLWSCRAGACMCKTD